MHTVIQFLSSRRPPVCTNTPPTSPGSNCARLIERHPDFYPMYTMEGRWKHSGEAWTHWCDGFLPGHDVDPLRPAPDEPDRLVARAGRAILQAARAAASSTATCTTWASSSCPPTTAGTGSPRPALQDVLIQAGRTMGLRFKEKGKYLRSFVVRRIAVHRHHDERRDHLLRRRGDRRRAPAGCGHAARLTTRRVLVRGDGSTAHEGMFDLETGEFLRQTTHQGYRGDSCWSRGLAWSLYGFGTCYRYTRDAALPETAEAERGFLHRAHARRRRAAVGLRRAGGEPQAAGHLGRGHRRLRALPTGKLSRRRASRASSTSRPPSTSWPRSAEATSARATPGLGRHPQGRGLSHPQGAGRERVGDVGGVLLPRGPGAGAGVGWV